MGHSFGHQIQILIACTMQESQCGKIGSQYIRETIAADFAHDYVIFFFHEFLAEQSAFDSIHCFGSRLRKGNIYLAAFADSILLVDILEESHLPAFHEFVGEISIEDYIFALIG